MSLGTGSPSSCSQGHRVCRRGLLVFILPVTGISREGVNAGWVDDGRMDEWGGGGISF